MLPNAHTACRTQAHRCNQHGPWQPRCSGRVRAEGSPALGRPQSPSWAVQWRSARRRPRSPSSSAWTCPRRCWSAPRPPRTAQSNAANERLLRAPASGGAEREEERNGFANIQGAFKLTCRVQSALFFRNSTNLSTTPGVFMTSSMGGFGSGINRWYIGCVCVCVFGQSDLFWNGGCTFGEKLSELLCCGQLKFQVFWKQHLHHLSRDDSFLKRQTHTSSQTFSADAFTTCRMENGLKKANEEQSPAGSCMSVLSNRQEEDSPSLERWGRNPPEHSQTSSPLH